MNETQCALCKLAEEKTAMSVYEDNIMKAVLVDKPSAPGHMLLFPKKHYTIFEQVPDHDIERLFIIANKLSTAAFESLNMQGTNLLINNGVAAGQQHAHFSVHLIPRRENDGLNFEWKPKQLSEEEMSTVELTLRPQTEVLTGIEEPEKPVTQETEKESMDDSDDNYLTRQLRRIP